MIIIKIGIISDAHLFHKKAISTDKYKDIILNEFKDVDIIVDCGDIVDNYNIIPSQIDGLYNIFNNVEKPYYYVAGNHDSLSNNTIASILRLNKNIIVIQDKPALIDNILFVPYTNNIAQLYKDLNDIIEEPVNLAFSHLGITDLHYATIRFNKDTKNLYKYANTWFNGHIHEPQIDENVFGKVYNVGSCSSLTYGDNHIPNYCVYNTDTEELFSYPIKDSTVHITYLDTDNLEDKFDYIRTMGERYKVCVRFKISNDKNSIETKSYIKEELKDCTQEILFNYLQSNKEIKEINNQKELYSYDNLLKNLISNFEKENTIDDSIKEMIFND